MNHNVSLVRNDKGEEVIVIGKGIAFGKKKGDLIAEDQVEKIFRMKTEESRENFMALLKDVPLDFITVTYEIIDNLSKKYHYPIQEYLYVTLTDHIRFWSGLTKKNVLNAEDAMYHVLMRHIRLLNMIMKPEFRQ